MFPRWECFVPKVGIICHYLIGNKRHLFEKSLISPVNPSECLYLKEILDFDPSLDPSLDLSHNSPVVHELFVSAVKSLRVNGGDDGRDLGGIEIISPVPKPLCAKAFSKI